MDWKKFALFAGGLIFGTCGLKLLGSDEAKKVYTNTTAAAFRVKDGVMRDVANIRETAEDIAAAAKEKNVKRELDAAAQIIDDISDEITEKAETSEV